MRGFSSFVVGILSAIIIVVLAIFAVENIHGVTAHFFGFTFTPGLWWVAIGSAVLGFILAFLLLAPGRVASGWRARGLERSRLRAEQEMGAMRQEHESLRAQHAHMQAEREGLQTERDQLRARLTAVNNAASLPATGGSSRRNEPVETVGTAGAASTAGRGYTSEASYNAGDNTRANYDTGTRNYNPDSNYAGSNYDANGRMDGGTGTAQPAPDRSETVTEPEPRAYAPEQPPAQPAAQSTEPTAQAQQEHQLGVGGRLKSMFSRPREEQTQEEQNWNNNQPPVPSA